MVKTAKRSSPSSSLASLSSSSAGATLQPGDGISDKKKKEGKGSSSGRRSPVEQLLGSVDLNFEEFSLLMEQLETRAEIVELFAQYASSTESNDDDDDDDGLQGSKTTNKKKEKKSSKKNVKAAAAAAAAAAEAASASDMSAAQLAQFLRTHQREVNADESTARAIIERVQGGETPNPHLTLVGFSRYLAGVEPELNLASGPRTLQVYQDMTRPLNEYWIATSHNTYLLGHQLTGESSVEAYKAVLLAGCRCVEVDCWDGGSADNEPIVYHGRTLTSKILFRDVVQAVLDWGFKSSPYPVILSFENHCSEPFQRRMVEHIKNILGERLAEPFFGTSDLEGGGGGGGGDGQQQLPSPEQLRGKVVIKGKVGHSGTVPDDDDEQQSLPAELKGKAAKVKHIVPELSQITHLHACKYGTASAPHHMSSFSESKLEKLVSSAKSSEEFVQHLSTHLARIYPKAMRIDSSNYNPVLAWTHGAQLVALNYQSGAKNRWFADALFADNGACGFVLKPAVLRDPSTPFNPKSKKLAVQRQLLVTVISAFRLPPEMGGDEVIDPYVKVDMRGVPADTHKERTKSISDNGFHPVWREQFTFPLREPDLALLLFNLYDRDIGTKDDYIAHYAIRVSSIREGTRSMPLLKKDGTPWPGATLLVHFEWA